MKKVNLWIGELDFRVAENHGRCTTCGGSYERGDTIVVATGHRGKHGCERRKERAETRSVTYCETCMTKSLGGDLVAAGLIEPRRRSA
jgi:thioredoxin reductase